MHKFLLLERRGWGGGGGEMVRGGGGEERGLSIPTCFRFRSHMNHIIIKSSG